MLIGIDCATQDSKVGIAWGTLTGTVVEVAEALVCGRTVSAASQIADWTRSASGPTLLAIDAPLGWPTALGPQLINHSAGKEISTSANELFRRKTDRFIQERLKKTPLDVGADRIARTAHAALRMIGELRHLVGQPIPMAWSPAITGIEAIEVYPAATLLSRGIRSGGYKRPENISERREIIEGLASELMLRSCITQVEQNADALDAAVCLLAAADFVRGQAAPPEDTIAAVREGWIWTRVP